MNKSNLLEGIRELLISYHDSGMPVQDLVDVLDELKCDCESIGDVGSYPREELEPVKTKIFKNFAEFNNREDKTVNGVSSEFAEKHPDFEEMSTTNSGCWCCLECDNCIDCVGCIKCSSCSSCTECANCNNCDKCDDCKCCDDCTSCTDCTCCADCADCGMCICCVNCNCCYKCNGAITCINCNSCISCGSCEGLFGETGVVGK